MTYVLMSSAVKLTPLDATAYKGIQGTFAEAAFSLASVPASIPYVTNLVSDGVLMQDVLDTKELLDDWVEQSARYSDAGDGLFAMPKQCQEPLSTPAHDTVPPNAMIRFDSNPSKAVLADVFDVRASDDGAGYVMTLRQVPAAAAATPAREGVCHAKQSLSADGTGGEEHYHHQSTCLETILDWNLKEVTSRRNLKEVAVLKEAGVVGSASLPVFREDGDGDGAVMFIKIRVVGAK